MVDQNLQNTVSDSTNLEQSIDNKEHRFASAGILEIKSLDNDLIVKGYIATTHKDKVNDIVTKEALQTWADEINMGLPRANKVTYHHDRNDVRVVGVGIKGSARVDNLPDGHYGLYVETKINKTHPFAEIIEYEYKNDMLDSFSIEYIAASGKKTDSKERVLKQDTVLYGWTLASRPVNDNAVMIKEIMRTINQNSEVQTMADENKVEILEKELKEVKSQLQVVLEQKEEDMKKSESEKKKKQEEAEIKQKEESKKKMEEMYAKKEGELNASIVELKEAIASIKETTKAAIETKEDKTPIELKELQNGIEKGYDYKELAVSVGKYLENRGLQSKEDFSAISATKEMKEEEFGSRYITRKIEGKEVIEFKGLSVGDNVNSSYINASTTIGLSQAELQDVVMPVIFNALNETTVTWDLLAKDNMRSQGTNRVVFVLKTGNTGAYFSKGNAITTTETDREKYAIEYKKIYISGAVDGDLQAYSRGGPFGEALALEVADRTIALKVKMNQALFDENAGNKADAAPLGIPAITDSVGNATLYNTTRSAANKLSPDSAGDTYVNGGSGLTMGLLRDAIEQATVDGAQLQDLIFVTTPAVVNIYKELFDSLTRYVPYSNRAGFNNAPDFEGVPMFADKDCKSGSIFLIDTKALRVAILVPPTVEILGKRSDSSEFFVKSYYAVYCATPRRLVEIYGVTAVAS